MLELLSKVSKDFIKQSDFVDWTVARVSVFRDSQYLSLSALAHPTGKALACVWEKIPEDKLEPLLEELYEEFVKDPVFREFHCFLVDKRTIEELANKEKTKLS